MTSDHEALAIVGPEQKALVPPPRRPHGEAGAEASEGGLPERQDSAHRVSTAAASGASEDDHGERGRHLHGPQAGHQQGEWQLSVGVPQGGAFGPGLLYCCCCCCCCFSLLLIEN